MQPDEILIRYLLGASPDEEEERLDELSITDVEFSWRLKAAENDLVDAYLRDELSAETVQRFESFYLASPLRREKVEFARTLLLFQERESQPHTMDWFSTALLIPRWAAVAAAGIVMIASVLLYDNLRLRKRSAESQSTLAALEQRQQQLQRELEQSRSASSKPAAQNDDAASPATVAFLLLPPRRGAAQIPELAVPSGRDPVLVDLQLETDDFPAYDVALQVLATNQVIWRAAAPLKASLRDGRKVISLRVPARFLRSHRYMLALSSASPDPEPIGNYAFQVIFK
jgi:hypothetical protein